MIRRPPRSTLFPYTTLFRSDAAQMLAIEHHGLVPGVQQELDAVRGLALGLPFLANLGHMLVQGQQTSMRLANVLLGPGDVEYVRSEEHTSELQSRLHLVCRL